MKLLRALRLTEKNAQKFTDWIGLQWPPAYSNSPLFGRSVGAFLSVTAFALVVGALATIIQFLAIILLSGTDHEAIRNVGWIVAAVVGAPFVVWRAVVAQKQTNIAEQSHITDQINKAVAGLGSEKTVNKIGRPVTILTGDSKEVVHLVEDYSKFELGPRSVEVKRYHDLTDFEPPSNDVFDGLHVMVRTWAKERTEIEWQGTALENSDDELRSRVGDWSVFSETAPNIEVRIGSIYALERIAQDSLRDHLQVMEILTAYIRGNAPVGSLVPSTEPFKRARPRPDIQAALDVIGRRSPDRIAFEHEEKYRLDLREVDLSGANFSRGNFEGALLIGSRLEAAVFRDAKLRAVRLNGCLLNFSDYFQVDMRGAIMDNAVMSRAKDIGTSFTLAKNIQGLSMASADISGIRYLPKKDTHLPTFATKDTILHGNLSFVRTERRKDLEDQRFAVDGIEQADFDALSSRLDEAGMRYWSPFDASDMSTGGLRDDMWRSLGFTDFPYRD